MNEVSKSIFTNVQNFFDQVHTFYEAVGYMISAQFDAVMQEHLIEKYMLLPNQVWDDIISQAATVNKYMFMKYRQLKCTQNLTLFLYFPECWGTKRPRSC